MLVTTHLLSLICLDTREVWKWNSSTQMHMKWGETDNENITTIHCNNKTVASNDITTPAHYIGVEQKGKEKLRMFTAFIESDSNQAVNTFHTSYQSSWIHHILACEECCAPLFLWYMHSSVTSNDIEKSL